VKLKKLHKMGDVENTILKHFEKEKNDFRSKSDPYLEYFFFKL